MPRSLVARQEVPLVSRKWRDRRDRHQGRTLEGAEQRAGPCRRASLHQRRGRARRGRTNRCSFGEKSSTDTNIIHGHRRRGLHRFSLGCLPNSESDTPRSRRLYAHESMRMTLVDRTYNRSRHTTATTYLPLCGGRPCVDSSCTNISALVSMTMEIFAVTWDAQPALGRFVVRIILGIVTGVTVESPRSSRRS